MRIEVGERILTVEVAGREAHGFTVTVDDRQFHADLVRVGPRWSLLVGAAGGPARSYEVAIDQEADGTNDVLVNGLVVRTRSEKPARWQPGRSGASSTAVGGARPVVAPMPGRVVKVLVHTGEAVVSGQGLAVVEAMKMENELRAAMSGVVTEVRVSEGALVDAGAVLLVVDSKV